MTAYTCAYTRHPATGWRVVKLSATDPASGLKTVAQFTPEVGANLLGLAVGETEYLVDVDRAAGNRILGTPILYPTPNRIRDGVFTFGGRTFRFAPNMGRNFIHGLVREIPWECGEPIVTPQGLSITAHYTFAPGSAPYDLFPIRNTLELTYTLRPSALRLEFTVRNEDERELLPFGLAIHPYFRIIGPREAVRIQVPAQRWMEAVELLPTGRLVDLAHGPADLSQPTPLTHLNLDDVFWGLEPAKPQVIYYDQLGTQVTLTAAELFTHSVVYTPQGRGYFCLENQSCSTDTHNLYARGLQEAAHLTLLAPGQALRAWVELTVGTQ